ncbi:MAG: serine/threonine protein phosphatase [Proteobacteria bacterium]|nr:serine/threonine protein phosphatase [Pseudomonadota bacterium]MBU4258254.1 serine/threonine protein phosphatase [Pseudomonadota bacterium]MBU4288227.1 serine/threonine protein phosphatase [Pseudomonadota bacterium]MCG2758976.1 serine/threonine protein phosphatase [Desulfobacteraceae bacterium]
MGKIFAIGDIHGCFDKLHTLMALLEVNKEKDILIFLGDYIDRGPQSMDVVEYLIHLSQDGYHTIFLKGNHEAMLQDYLSGQDKTIFLLSGGTNTLDSYRQHQHIDRFQNLIIPPSHIKFFQSLRLFYETDSYMFVHAGLVPKVPLNQQQEKDLLWIRDPFIHSTHDFGKTVIFGHTPFKEPFVTKNKIGIDTGAVYDNKLTCIELPAQKFYSV